MLPNPTLQPSSHSLARLSVRVVRRRMQTLGSLCALMFVTASACVYPARHRLPELDVQLLDQAVPVREARVGYSWAWGQVACDQSLNAIHADTEGRFILPAKTSWGIGA